MRRWAIDYHADGFRFDLMGHLPKATVERAKVPSEQLSTL